MSGSAGKNDAATAEFANAIGEALVDCFKSVANSVLVNVRVAAYVDANKKEVGKIKALLDEHGKLADGSKDALRDLIASLHELIDHTSEVSPSYLKERRETPVLCMTSLCCRSRIEMAMAMQLVLPMRCEEEDVW